MFRIFYKCIFTYFLIAILFVNLLYFGNNIRFISQLGVVTGSYENRYFGISTLIRFFQTGFSSSDDDLLANLYRATHSVLDTAIKWSFEDWVSFSNSGGVTDLISGLTLILNILKSIASVFMFIAYPVVMVTYIIIACSWICIKFIVLISGGYWDTLPIYTYA